MKTTLLVIAHTTDAGAASVAEYLQRTSASIAIQVIRPEVLSLARWSHRVDSQGHASTVVRLPGWLPLASNDIAAVLNRIQYLPMPRFQRASPKDRDYAAAEMHALVASWLAELGDRVVNVVHRYPWVIPPLSLPQWGAVAAMHGLPVARYCFDTRNGRHLSKDGHGNHRPHWIAQTPIEPITGSVLVAGDHVGGTLAHEFGRPCLAIAQTLGFTLIEFFFTNVSGSWELVDATLFPELETSMKVTLVSTLLHFLSVGEHE